MSDTVQYVNKRHKELKSLRDATLPKRINTLDCSFNFLTSLDGCPWVRTIHCDANLLTSLIGCPKSVRTICCSINNLRSLEGLPEGVEYVDCRHNQIETLEHLPLSVTTLRFEQDRLSKEYRRKTLEEIHRINGSKRFFRAFVKLNRYMMAIRIQRVWRRWWYDILDEYGVNRFCKNDIKGYKSMQISGSNGSSTRYINVSVSQPITHFD